VNSAYNPTYDAGLKARFAGAARHSRLVRFLRIAVPVAVVLSMAIIIGVVILARIIEEKGLKIPKIENLAVSGTKITMVSPHLSGYTPDRRPYELWATTATQDITDPDRVELKALRAKLLMEDKSTLNIQALTGLFNNKQQVLDLRKNIVLQTTTGYEARLSQASVDMSKGTVTSNEHVDVKLTNGTLSSDGLKVSDGGAVVRFEGNVVMRLENTNPDMPAPEAPVEEPQPEKMRPLSNKSTTSK